MIRSHCQFCGAKYNQTETWPRFCVGCGQEAFLSPQPVVNLILTVSPDGAPKEKGVILIRRNIEPFKGTLAFPGGYVDHSEDWRRAALREAKEELGVTLLGVPYLIGEPISTRHTNYLVLFATVHDVITKPEDIPALADPLGVSNGEISEVLLTGFKERENIDLGVPVHQAVWKSLFRDDYGWAFPSFPEQE